MSKSNLLKSFGKNLTQRKMKLSIGIVFVLLFLNPTVSNAQIVIQPLSTNSPTLVSARFSDGAVSTPSITFTSESNTGWYHRAGNTLTASIFGSNFLDLNNANGFLEIGNGTSLAWSTTSDASASRDVVLRRSATKTLTIDTDGAGGALTLVDIKSGVQVQTSIGFASSTTFTTTANKELSILDNAGATGLELNLGTPTLGTCTGGTLVSGAHNGMGEITGNTSGSCVLNFGTPNFINTPFCILNDETNLVAARVSARSASSITITGLTSGDAVQYICVGRIGT